MKPHSLVRIKSTMVNVPHLIEPNAFNTIMGYVNDRIKGSAEIGTPEAATFADMEGDFKSRYDANLKLGVMEITGPLTYRTSGWEAMCGGTSYEMLKSQMEYFVDKGATTVAMRVDSGGGQAHGMIDSANYMRKLADENGIKIIAYVDGMSASAAYGISCIADEIVMSSDSQVGSIGVLIQLYNDSKYLEKIGYERTFITAGKDKVPFDKDGAFTKSFIDKLQEQVDTLYEGFTSHVATHRKIDISAVKGTEANVFMADKAIALGLADKTMTPEEFSHYLVDFATTNKGNSVNPLKSVLKMNFKQEGADMNAAELTDALAKATAKLESETAARAAADTQLASAVAQVGVLTAQLDEVKQALASIKDAEAAAQLESRQAVLKELLPADQVEAKLASYGSLDQATFDFIAGELRAAKEARAASFKPHGENGAEEESDEAEASEDTSYQALLAAGVAAAKAVAR